MKNWSLCIDLGGTSAKCAFIEDQKIMYRYVVETKIGAVLENIVEKTKTELAQFGLSLQGLNFIGLSCCGLIDHEKGILIWSGNLELNNYPFLTEAKRLFQTDKVFLLNDGKSATYGEWAIGQKKNCDSMMLYTIGTGIGGSLILNNQLYFGTCEPGHGAGLQNVFQCNCNLDGCIEGLSSSTGIEKILNFPENKKYFAKKIKIEPNHKITIKDVSSLLQNQDPFTVKIFSDSWLPLAKHISVTLHLLDLKKIVIGGGPSNLGQPLIDILKKHLKTLLLPAFYEKLDLEIAQLKNDAGIWGIYEWSREHASETKLEKIGHL